MEDLSSQTMSNRMKSVLRQKADKRVQDDRRSLMYLVAEFLREQGLFKTLEVLTEEAHISDNYEVCDNIDLEILLHEYNNYYQARFNKLPRICKRVENLERKESLSKGNLDQKNANKPKLKPNAKRSVPGEDRSECNNLSDPDVLELRVESLPLKEDARLRAMDDNTPWGDEKILRPLGNLYPAGSELREMAEIIRREIVTTDLNVHWEDIFGLEDCKQALKEAVVYPVKYPETFNDVFTPWKGILLYGPPGTGKTMLAKAVATECNCTFFNITASSLVSKWRGDSEKYVRVLFELAKHHAPSVIFIDEIDWVAAGEGALSSDRSEPARRFRAELLSQLDGLKSLDNSRVFLLATTNAPWNLDASLCRRLEKHILVDLPSKDVRRKILDIHMPPYKWQAYESIIQNTDGYSPADLKLVCKQAWMLKMQPIWKMLEEGQETETEKDDEIFFYNVLQNKVKCYKPNHMTSRYTEWNTLQIQI